jgi:hypothetical protein
LRLAGEGEGRAKRYLRPSIHSVSACEPRPSAASIAALYPRNAWSLDTIPLVGGFSARSTRKPATAQAKAARVDADERALFCPGQLFLTALHAAEGLERHGLARQAFGPQSPDPVPEQCHIGDIDARGASFVNDLKGTNR